MKRHESGYGMKIIMKPTATKRQIEIAKKMYPHALVIKEIDMPKVNFKTKWTYYFIKYKLYSY